MNKLFFLFSLIVISFCFGSTVVSESRFPSKQDNSTAKFETNVLTEEVISYDFNPIQTRKASCSIASKLSECTSISSQPPNKDKLTCYKTSDLFTSAPGTIKLEVFECSSLDRKNCHRVYFLKQGKDYQFEDDEVCVSTDRKRVCSDNKNKYGASGACYRFYDISIPSCDVKSSIVVGNSKEAIKNPKGSCSPPKSPFCKFVPSSTESFESFGKKEGFDILDIFSGEANIYADYSGYIIQYGRWSNYVDGKDFEIYDGKLAAAAGDDEFDITFKSPIQSFNGYFANCVGDEPITFKFYDSDNKLIHTDDLEYDPVKEKSKSIYYGYCSSSNDIKKITFAGREPVMDQIGFKRSK